jgi:DNA-binding LytR/AlgR family response regulator
MKARCIIVDDDLDAIDILTSYIQNIPGLEVYKVYTNPIKALLEITDDDNVDLTFLDIDMPGMSGLELAASIGSKTQSLIFTTAHDEHALTAFNLNADQYFLKPFSFGKFAQGIAKINEKRNLTQLHQIEPAISESSNLFIKGDYKGRYRGVHKPDICYIEAMLNYVKVVTISETLITYLSMREIELALGNTDYIRISRSHIVSKTGIRKIEGNQVFMANNVPLAIGGKYRYDFFEYIDSRLLRSDPKI